MSEMQLVLQLVPHPGQPFTDCNNQKDTEILVLPTTAGYPLKRNSKERLSSGFEDIMYKFVTIPMANLDHHVYVSFVAAHGSGKFLLRTILDTYTIIEDQVVLSSKLITAPVANVDVDVNASKLLKEKMGNVEVVKYKKGNSAFKRRHSPFLAGRSLPFIECWLVLLFGGEVYCYANSVVSFKENFVLGTFSATMDDAADFPCQFLFSHPEMPDSFDEFLNSATTTCTHTHSCNPPGPSAAMHTHTCLHTHTQVFGSGGEEDDTREDSTKPRRPLGNREAVRKYREKKKAHAAFLEEEVKKLRAANQQLLRRLQGHAALEAEVVRLRSLLHDVRGKIDAEVGALPFQKPCSVGSVACADPALCFNGNSEVGAWEESSRPAAADCCRNDEGTGMSRD
ncbi:hypothetical protein U9M48_044416 [Paspalum notatum var. saurae]|uniref:BZIP domain-containing protein n=1 Tax=Paspalum notatum var. saurae TaxID=547442 RepID=A0AAQ3UZ94_PASNO